LEPFSEAVQEINALKLDYEEKIKKAKNEDEKKLAEAKFNRKTLELLQNLYASLKPSGFGKISQLFSGIMLPSVEQEMFMKVNKIIRSHYHAPDYQMGKEISLDSLISQAKLKEADLTEKVTPLTGHFILKAYVRRSNLGNPDEYSNAQQVYFTGKFEPQTTSTFNAMNYIASLVMSGAMKSMLNMGPFAGGQKPVVQNYSFAQWGTLLTGGLARNEILPTAEQLFNGVETASHKAEKNIGHLTNRMIDRSQVKEAYLVDQEKTLPSAEWEQKNENNFLLYKDQALTDPYQCVYIVVPAKSRVIDRSHQNEWKLCFYNFKQAEAFIPLIETHPYWYDKEKGWNLNGWPEKMTALDKIVMHLESILTTYLSPDRVLDFEPYFEQNQPLPIHNKLNRLYALILDLQEKSLQLGSDDIEKHILQISKEIEHTFEEINELDQGQMDYGLSQALRQAEEYINELIAPPQNSLQF
jgi:hypothetical protein